jgi:lipid A ethanolaminephosphotransferase
MSTVQVPAAAARPPSPHLANFLAPRYWGTWLFVGWLRFAAALPWQATIAIHRWIGRAAWLLLPARRLVVIRNLEICFPELDAQERLALARRSFENAAASIGEVGIAWFGRRLPPVRVEGREHLDAALAKGNGVILLSGHFTTLELTGHFVKPLTPRFAFMFRSRGNALLDAVQARGRGRMTDLSFSNSDTRAMLRALRDNATVWYAPDQVHTGAGAELLPFFGEPAMTNTATARLARASGAAVLPFQFRRLDDGSGYLVRFEPPVAGVPSGDATADTMKLTSVLEGFVRSCPEQYLWTHRRFKGRGSRFPDAYARRSDDTTQERVRWRDIFSTPLLIAAVALFIVVADNDPLWRAAWRATQNDDHRLGILATIFALVFVTLTTVLSLALGTKLLRALAALLLVVAASCGFFMTQYGVVIDQSMIRNAVETTVLEATPLLSSAYFWHVAFYGVLPAILVFVAPLARLRWPTELAVRFGTAAAGIALLAATLYVNYAAAVFFGRENDDLKLQINPAYPLWAAASFVASSDNRALEARSPLDVRVAPAAPRKPALVVLVMGETARADRFSFNGYERDTNRYTRALDVVNFPRVVSCGTSTAESLPCIFSGLGHAQFSHAAAMGRESIVGAMQRLGISTFWRDNSTGCKSVCDDQHFEQRAEWTQPDLCDTTGCFDEVLLEDFDALLSDRTRDHLVVLHQRGSHGPAYHTDVPRWAKEYFPECALPNLRNCDRAAINNSYDNTILYTDYFVSRVIDALENRSAEFDVAMLYVSDHGESLGENGLYLHGLPYSLAPREQTEVPMLFWASPGFYAERAAVDPQCLRGSAQNDTSHDAIFHTLLPIFGLSSPLYDERLDLLASCRGQKLAAVRDR